MDFRDHGDPSCGYWHNVDRYLNNTNVINNSVTVYGYIALIGIDFQYECTVTHCTAHQPQAEGVYL